MFKSIRGRLLIWHAGILLAAVAGFATALYLQIRKARFDEIDAELYTAARSLEGTLRGFPLHVLDGFPDPPPLPFREGPLPSRPRSDETGNPPPLPPPPWRRPEARLALPPPLTRRIAENDREAPYFVVWLANGEILKTSPMPPAIFPPEGPLPPDSRPGLQLRQRGRQREIIMMGPRASQILVGRSIQRERDELAWLAWQLAITGAAVLSVGLVGGWLLSSRAVRPIAAMSATAASISASNLGQRIDVAELDSELGKLASILNDMFARLESAFARQVRFTADASHELRTPLAILHARSELTLSRPREAEEYREALDTCLRASRRMGSLVDGLLTLARADAGKLELKRQPLDLGALVMETVALLEPLAAEKNITLSVKAPSLEITADPTRMVQVITNLAANAIHYNRPGGSVAVALEASERQAVLTVADTGQGIPEEDRPHIFERFYRVDKARSREQGGSGLGLAICQSIVEALGGVISFTTVVNRGTTFTVRMPLETAT